MGPLVYGNIRTGQTAFPRLQGRTHRGSGYSGLPTIPWIGWDTRGMGSGDRLFARLHVGGRNFRRTAGTYQLIQNFPNPFNPRHNPVWDSRAVARNADRLQRAR